MLILNTLFIRRPQGAKVGISRQIQKGNYQTSSPRFDNHFHTTLNKIKGDARVADSLMWIVLVCFTYMYLFNKAKSTYTLHTLN